MNNKYNKINKKVGVAVVVFAAVFMAVLRQVQNKVWAPARRSLGAGGVMPATREYRERSSRRMTANGAEAAL